MTVREALGLLDARRITRLRGIAVARWTVQDAEAVAMVTRYVAELEAEHPTTSLFLRKRLDRAAT